MKFAQAPKLLAASMICLTLILSQYKAVETNPTTDALAPITGVQGAKSGPTSAQLSQKPARPIHIPPRLANEIMEIALADSIAQSMFAITQEMAAPVADILEPVHNQPVVEIISPAFQRFIDRVSDGEEGVIRGIYVAGSMALQVIQQPERDAAFVSNKPGIATQFQSAAVNGVTGLLAHNYLSGKLFYRLSIGQRIQIVYGDGSVREYQITEIERYQKLTPSSLQSKLIDQSNGELLTTEQVFTRFYRGEHHLTLQTCLEGEGVSNWGLTFIVALPVEDLP